MASGRSSSESASQGRRRLEAMALAVLHGLCTGEECCITFPDRTAVEFSEEKGSAHALVSEQRTMSMREFYYAHATLFNAQQECDDTILDVAALAGVSRSALGVLSAAKGLAFGDFELVRQGRAPIRATPATGSWTIDPLAVHDAGAAVRTSAAAVLVVEKEGIFARLVEDGFAARHCVLLVTGKGYPDLATRAFLRLVHDAAPAAPVLGLCDCNPHGTRILLTYRCGSARMGLDADRHAVPVAYLGLHPEEAEGMDLPRAAYQALTPRDRALAARLLAHPLVRREESWGAHVRAMDRLGAKVELEALHVFGLHFLSSEWLPAKVCEAVRRAHLAAGGRQ